ncbi:MAG: hypothetical protein WCG25_02650 [bacterium]
MSNCLAVFSITDLSIKTRADHHDVNPGTSLNVSSNIQSDFKSDDIKRKS